jgi:hypothetical protein
MQNTEQGIASDKPTVAIPITIEATELLHTSDQIVFFSFDQKEGSYLERLDHELNERLRWRLATDK